ncbi:hypothetical protein [Hydromonas duriensis]|nr:hypothetical protein [Hydromonas duriensis]
MNENHFLANLSYVATIAAVVVAIWTYFHNHAKTLKNASSSVVLELRLMNQNIQALKASLILNNCELHFSNLIKAGCNEMDSWSKNKSILIAILNDGQKAKDLDLYYAICCEIDEHIKRCKDEFYSSVRDRYTHKAEIIVDSKNGNGEIKYELTECESHQAYTQDKYATLLCFTPEQVIRHLKEKILLLNDVSYIIDYLEAKYYNKRFFGVFKI